MFINEVLSLNPTKFQRSGWDQYKYILYSSNSKTFTYNNGCEHSAYWINRAWTPTFDELCANDWILYVN